MSVRYDYAYAPPEPKSAWLIWAGTLAFLLEAGTLAAVGWQHHWIAHPQNPGLDTTRYIEAQMFEAPEPAHLVEEKKIAAPPAPKEATISKSPGAGKPAQHLENPAPEKNVTQGGPPPLANHGPIAVSTPTPEIPDYLRGEDLKASAVIDFYITAQGAVSPKLVGSTGNEELDALALSTAARWQFRPAEKDHKAIDSKVRLRMVFEVK